MNRLLNNPEQVVDEMLAGYIASYPGQMYQEIRRCS